MVLPWVTDQRSPPFRKDLLGCPYFDAKVDEIIFAVDNRYSLNIRQSSYSKLREPVFELDINSNNVSDDKMKIRSLRKELQDTFVPTSLLESCLNELGRDEINVESDNKLLFRRNPYFSDQFIAIHPDVSGKDLVIDYINEIDVGNANSGLCFFDTARVEFGFPIRSIKSHKNSLFAAASNQTIRLYSIEKESVDEIFECVSPVEDYFSSFDVSPYEKQVCAIQKHDRKLTFFNEDSSQSYILSEDFFNCSYTFHPSLVALSGNSNKIEIKDIRGTFPGLSISDQHVPFQSVRALIPHERDGNLIAISCTADGNVYNDRDTISEVRIYDLRYPKESTMRVATDSPVVQFIAYDSFIQETTDHLIGLDSASTLINWEFRHSKSNTDYSDGILSLAECTNLMSRNQYEISENQNFIGFSAAPSFVNDEAFFFSRLTDDGQVDYCKLYKNGSDDSYSESFSNHEETSEVLDFTHISEIYAANSKKLGIQSKTINESFGPMCQSTFHLDFYWDELKAKIYHKSN